MVLKLGGRETTEQRRRGESGRRAAPSGQQTRMIRGASSHSMPNRGVDYFSEGYRSRGEGDVPGLLRYRGESWSWRQEAWEHCGSDCVIVFHDKT